ncbi:hypothetical protein ABEB36_012572 [Hypothenemus hampei]|uniref:ER membrane protein complex subunit 6 n=1 Tax=Hypothenemus hampei TaxID=57062 RepID=A0ABD1EDR9_HYPHA
MSAKSKQVTSVAYSESAIRNNLSIVEYCRTSMAALSGCTAGILGLTSLYGALFFVCATITVWLMFLYKAGFSNWNKYFISRKSLLTSGFYGQLFTYILCWTFIYGMVHVY